MKATFTFFYFVHSWQKNASLKNPRPGASRSIPIPSPVLNRGLSRQVNHWHPCSPNLPDIFLWWKYETKVLTFSNKNSTMWVWFFPAARWSGVLPLKSTSVILQIAGSLLTKYWTMGIDPCSQAMWKAVVLSDLCSLYRINSYLIHARKSLLTDEEAQESYKAFDKKKVTRVVNQLERVFSFVVL